MPSKTSEHNTYIVTGSVQQGKTTFMKKVVELLCARQMKVGGFLAEGYFKHNVRSGFDLMHIPTKQRVPFCTIEPTSGWVKNRRFYFNPEVVQVGGSWLENDLLDTLNFMVIDELGHFELVKQGWFNSVLLLQQSFSGTQIYVVRRSLVEPMADLFQWQNFKIIDIEEINLQLFVSELVGTQLQEHKL